MFPMIISMLLTGLTLGEDGPAKTEVRLLIDTIEALQRPVEDFRCEFEGTIRYKGKVAEGQKLGDDGLYESYSGIFIWKQGGDIRSESLHRRASDGEIARESLVVRMREHQAEQYHRLNDQPLGFSVVQNPKDVNIALSNPASIFLIDRIKQDVADDTLECSVSDDQIDERPLKVLSVALKGVADSLLYRYWVDLKRSGQVVRREAYMPGKIMGIRLDIKLARFKFSSEEIWMPVSGDTVGYGAMVDKKPVITKEPTSLETTYIVGGAIEFNKRPGREAFTIKYKPGTSISDNLRKLEYQFGQQKIGLRPTKIEAEKMLNEQIANADAQKAGLVVASQTEGFDWSSWIASGFVVLLLFSSVALWVQRWRH
jgi:hypothetical protein